MKKVFMLGLVASVFAFQAEAGIWDNIKSSLGFAEKEPEESASCDIDFSNGGNITIKAAKLRSFLKCLPESVDQDKINTFFAEVPDALEGITYSAEVTELGNKKIDEIKASGTDILKQMPQASFTLDGETTDVTGTINTAARLLGGIAEQVARSAVTATAQTQKDIRGVTVDINDEGALNIVKYKDEATFDEALTAAESFASFMVSGSKLAEGIKSGIGLNYVPQASSRKLTLTVNLENGSSAVFYLNP